MPEKLPETKTPTGFRLILGPPAALEEAFLAAVAAVRGSVRRSRRSTSSSAVSSSAPTCSGGSPTPLAAFSTFASRRSASSGSGSARRRLPQPAGRPLPAIAERAYTAEVARGCDGYFAPVAATPGLPRSTRQLLRELRPRGSLAGRARVGRAGRARVRREGRRPRRPLSTRDSRAAAATTTARTRSRSADAAALRRHRTAACRDLAARRKRARA